MTNPFPTQSTSDASRLLDEARLARDKSHQLRVDLGRLRTELHFELERVRHSAESLIKQSGSSTATKSKSVSSSGSSRLVIDFTNGDRTAVSPQILAALTPREIEVLRLIGEGKRTKEIAYILGIAFKTAVAHRSNLMEKLGIHEGPSLVRFAIRAGLCAA
jgi:DNA-binding NarL/FixJ family response regulator